MDECTFIVYVKTDSDGVITAINSSAFVNGVGWVEIDRGVGDRFHHAQGHYLEYGLADEDGIYNYKLVSGIPVLRTDEDKVPERARISAAFEVAALKKKLADTDYISAKIAEGAATRKEYADKLSERAAWRARINELEGT